MTKMCEALIMPPINIDASKNSVLIYGVYGVLQI